MIRKQFGEMIIKRSAEGVVTRLKDVARVEIDASEYGLAPLLDNHDAMALPIFRSPARTRFIFPIRSAPRWPS